MKVDKVVNKIGISTGDNYNLHGYFWYFLPNIYLYLIQ